MPTDDIGKKIQSLNIPSTVKLVAVSKTKPLEMIEEAYQYGQRIFGENYIQDAVPKIQNASHLPDIQWHFIGHLQSNKAQLAAQYFNMVQSVDSMKLAQKLNTAAGEFQKTLSVLIEINIGEEPQKHGISYRSVQKLMDFIINCPHLKLLGFMCIPPYGEEPRPYFQKMQSLFLKYKDAYHLTELSMGMSSDFQEAIQFGATMVRVGTKIFGKRNK
ncbi:Pyridoxal phosphate homeostasis protein [Candidatus Lokiarchaeum ossiferum]|uniref:Pyridoxal phosphate homeostasis protein n=1 Tax=Candidatus Lokiarchaeum ossiferum TaxID=2951803 RepID=A0ABY6HZJ7_9ARCH|nr:Pyridoxal phosphate homeostasis protein [Candidatus Lokiarchaeum sp. B-35]